MVPSALGLKVKLWITSRFWTLPVLTYIVVRSLKMNGCMCCNLWCRRPCSVLVYVHDEYMCNLAPRQDVG